MKVAPEKMKRDGFVGRGFYAQFNDASDVHCKSFSWFDIRTELVNKFQKHFTLPNLDCSNLYLSTVRPPNQTPKALVRVNRCNHKISPSKINFRTVNYTAIDNDIRLSTHLACLK